MSIVVLILITALETELSLYRFRHMWFRTHLEQPFGQQGFVERSCEPALCTVAGETERGKGWGPSE